MSAPTFVLHVLGGLSMKRIDTGVPVLLGQRKRLGLLAILASAGGAGVARERLLALLWPESRDGQARNALNQLLYVIRRELGTDAIIEADGALSLCPEVVGSDIGALSSALARGALAEAVTLYTGAFLDGVYLRDVPDFERWTENTRRALADAYADALDQLAGSALASRDASAAVRWARALVAHDPLSTRYAVRLIRALGAIGDRPAAIRHGELHSVLLKQELGLEPPAELVDVLIRLRDPQAGQATVSGEPIVQAVPAGPSLAEKSRWEPLRRRGRAAAGVTSVSTMLLLAALIRTERADGTMRIGALRQFVVVHGGPSEASISPDGKWIAFAASRPGDPTASGITRIYVQPIAGSRAVAVTGDSAASHESSNDVGDPFGENSPVWSPDGSRLAFKTPTAIQVVQALGGTPLTLISDPGGKRSLDVGGWSHDGTRIAFADTIGVWLYDLRTGRSKLLTRVGYERSHSPTWSPDDSLVAYVVGTGGIRNIAPSAIWIVRTSGAAPVQATDAVHFNTSPIFTPDGKNLLYVSNRDGARDIYQQPIVNGAISGRAVRLTTGANAANISLAADGRSMVYGSYVMRANIWSAPIAPHGQTPIGAARQITFGDQEVECMSVSNSGEWLLYDSNRSGNQDIYKIPIAGGDPIQLTTDPADDFCPTMSPNGDEVGFYSLRLGGVRRVFTMLSSGARQQPVLLDIVDEQQFGPSWRSDGNALAFSAARGGVRHVDMVFRDRTGRWSGLRHMMDIGGAIWSPDGKWLAVGGDEGIALATPDGGHRRVLVPRSRLSVFFAGAWGPNSANLYFRTLGDAGESVFWSVPTAGGEPRMLLRVGDALHMSRTAIFAVDAKRLYFTLSNDEAAIWRLELVP